jgi:hypothetical protein
MQIPAALVRALEIEAALATMAGKAGKKRAPKTRSGRAPTRGKRPARALSLEQAARATVEVFERVGVRWSLVGAGAYAVTSDFDFVIEADKLPLVLEALEARFGPLAVVDLGAAVRIESPPVDLIRSSSHALFVAALDRVQIVEAWRVPTPEMFMALKFLAAVSAWRGPDRKAQDNADLVRVYLQRGRASLDMALVTSLARRIYPGAEIELLELLRRVDAGEPISI